ncbi:MAG: glutamine amidotransferase [Candidatus Aramenus sulfurataquae]|jgi:GMP synthase-like glutamine amidotransferase|uniref:Glutamine amidotransferase n=2 Tax=Candidatus Aramenus sulfurataquae TaxID=1326980 RepID=W7KU23_9CREN|nr:MAG: glutamine amidotransferase [Candidatus Aramenus sulfurataquae]MCL7344466.1 type 1 glutamine amidotransferase [Candidatus Aramenus sulfurataquae]
MYLVIKNHPIEGPGILVDLLDDKVKEVMAWEDYPKDFDGLIVMGGPMGVYEADKYPFLYKEMEAIREALSSGKRVLGVCLGSQLTSKALGGEVVKGHFGPEVGVQTVRFLNHLGEKKVFQWHGDTFTLPPNSSLLAYSDKYFQAFTFKKALALQFHVEVDSKMVERWVEEYGGDRKVIESVREVEDELYSLAKELVKLWLQL